MGKNEESSHRQEMEYELDQEGNQIPVVQIPLSDLISGSFRTFDASAATEDCLHPEAEAAKQSSDQEAEQHSRSLVSSSPFDPNSKQVRTATLDAARAQMAVTAVYHSMSASLDGLSGKSCMDAVLNGPETRLNTMH